MRVCNLARSPPAAPGSEGAGRHRRRRRASRRSAPPNSVTGGCLKRRRTASSSRRRHRAGGGRQPVHERFARLFAGRVSGEENCGNRPLQRRGGLSKIAFAELQHADRIRYEGLPLETKDGRRVESSSSATPISWTRSGSSNATSATSRSANGRRRIALENRFLEAQVDSALDGILVVDNPGKENSPEPAPERTVEKFPRRSPKTKMNARRFNSSSTRPRITSSLRTRSPTSIPIPTRSAGMKLS